MEYLVYTLKIIEIILFIWLGFCVTYISILAVAGCLYKEKSLKHALTDYPKILVLIPAYKEDEVIIHTAKQAIQQDYPAYDVVVIADSLKSKTLKKLKDLPLKTVEVNFKESTKTKAINTTLKKLENAYDLVLTLDADNVMDQGVLIKFAKKFRQGNLAIQGHRTAKNTDSSFAVLDAISEEMNNHLYCKGAQTIGLTSRVIGSGMAIEYHLFKKIMSEIQAVGGFDKVLQLKLIESRNYIKYLDSALIFDEKVGSTKVFANQRKRWTSSQYVYLKKYFTNAFKNLFKGNYNYFMILLIHVFPPRVLLPVFVTILMLLSYLMDTGVEQFWAVLLIMNVLAYSIAVPKTILTSKHFLNALRTLPGVIITMLLTLFKLKGADRTFIHTPHGGKTNVKSNS
ncbi:MAG: glycosyltransferase family 2 protein [Flavobacteriaceae bacterium]|nr:glycosyltransferase family 2 protein [Flavobacteriaceae bacterium]